MDFEKKNVLFVCIEKLNRRVLLSLEDASITKTYAPILGLGAIGGMIIGFIVGKWGR